MSEELKPCPFCGGEARSGEYWPSWDTREGSIWCDAECGAAVARKTEAGAIAAWNTRATDACITSLEEENARFREALTFYATDHAWPNDGPWGVCSSDYGDVARAALSIRGEG